MIFPQPDAWHKTLAWAGASERSATTGGIAGQLVDFWYVLSRFDVIYLHYLRPSSLINVKFQTFLGKNLL